MATAKKSNGFTSPLESRSGPPMIGALLRMPVDAVHRRMFERLHERGFADLDPAHLVVFQWPGPDDSRPSELATRLQISKQALNYLLGQLEQLAPERFAELKTLLLELNDLTLPSRRP